MTGEGHFPKVYLHVGAGKTGSSSIQTALRENAAELEAQGCKYLGRLLERVEAGPSFNWQRAGATSKLFAKGQSKAFEDSYEVLSRELETLASKGMKSVIWSNESFFRRNAFLLPLIQELKADGCNVEVVCYVRRHDKWARSAYEQWGIKHKTYTGPLRDFQSWANPGKLSFAPFLERLNNELGDKLHIFNFDAQPDVVAHFMQALGLPEVSAKRKNESEPNEVTFARAVYNNRYKRQVRVVEFDNSQHWVKRLKKKANFLPELHDLLPNEKDMDELRAMVKDDKARVNTMLEERQQPQLEFAPFELKRSEIDQNRMNQLLLSVIFELQEKIAKLEEKQGSAAEMDE